MRYLLGNPIAQEWLAPEECRGQREGNGCAPWRLGSEVTEMDVESCREAIV